jgi:putative DNA primase/helicase
MLEMRWSIIPCGTHKKPLVTTWKPFQSRRPSPDEVMEWGVNLRPPCWAVITGEISGRITLDFDGEAGAATMRKLGLVPHRKTPSGSFHVDFNHPGHRVPTLNDKSKAVLHAKFPGMDIKGDGGYSIVRGKAVIKESNPPTLGEYVWLRDAAMPLQSTEGLPEELQAFLRSSTSAPEAAKASCKANGQGERDALRLIDVALGKLVQDGRNNTGFWLARQLRDNGFSQMEALAVMQDFAARCPSVNTKGNDEPYTSDEIRATLASAYSRPARESGGAEAQMAYAAAANEEWPPPEPLGGELPAVQAFDLKLLPEALRPLVEDTAQRMQVPLDFPAVTSVISLSAVTGGRALMLPKDQDPSWVVVPNLWGGTVGWPGIMKSPVIDTITSPLDKIEEQRRFQYEAAMKQYEYQKKVAANRDKLWNEQCKAALRNDEPTPPAADPPAEPVLRRLMTHDATYEKLHVMLGQNPAGILVKRDELSGWFAGLDKPGREGERAFFLLAANGQSGFIVDRMGRGTVWVPHCTVSFLGAITPARLRSYLADALRDGPTNDGLLQRFSLLVYPDLKEDWKWVNRAPNSKAIAAAEAIYKRLVALDIERPLRLYFDKDAQQLFIKWLTELENNKLRNQAINPVLVSHLAKFRKLLPALALLFELADGKSEVEVSVDHAAQAADFCDYAESHARRIYSMVISPERAAAAELGRHLKEGWKFEEGHFRVRDVYGNDWTGLDTPERVRGALPILTDAGWIRQITPPKSAGGRPPGDTYQINPGVRGRKP